jgi:hypothetical protein
VISVLAAPAPGLLTASAKRTFDNAEQNIGSYATDIVLLDQTLSRLDAEADAIRAAPLQYTAATVERTWGDSKPMQPLEDKEAGALLERMTHQILDMDAPFGGSIMVSGQPLRSAFAHPRGG